MRLKILIVLCLLLVTATSQAASFYRGPEAMLQLNEVRLQVDSGLFDHAKQQAIQVYMDDRASDTEKSYALYLLGLSMYRQSGSEEPENIPWDMLWIEYPDSPHALAVRLLSRPSETEAKLDSLDRPATKDFVLGELNELKSRSPRDGRTLRNVYWVGVIEDHPDTPEAELAKAIIHAY